MLQVHKTYNQARNIIKLWKYNVYFTRCDYFSAVKPQITEKSSVKKCDEIYRLSFQRGPYFSSSVHQTDSVVDHSTYEKACEETLESLTEYFEEIVEKADNLRSADVSYGSGVLTVNLGPKYGTYVINRQSPNKQIWLSSPTSGPKRYDFIVKENCWVYKHNGESLHQLLQNEISKIANCELDFSQCSYAKL